MFELQHSDEFALPAAPAVSNSPVDGAPLLEKEADAMGEDAADFELPEEDAPDASSDVEAILAAPSQPSKPVPKTKRAYKRAEDADRSTDPLALYAKDVRKHDLLTFEDEVRLSKEYRAGNAKA